MLKIVIVEDEKQSAELLQRLLKKYCEEKKITLEYEVYDNAVNFLDDNKADYDILLLDIQMPHMNGMELAQKLRKQNDNCIIIFVTNMAQYAIKGYEVDALGFMLKPVNYTNFAMVFERALNKIGAKGQSVTLSGEDGYVKVEIVNIVYVTSEKHYCYNHLSDGRDIRVRQSLNDVEEKFIEYGFVRCDRSALINLAYITKVDGNCVWVGKDCFTISRARKGDFMSRYAVWLGGGK